MGRLPISQSEPLPTRWRIPRAKTAAPRAPANFVLRKPLRDLLDRTADVPVTLVCAPAGYGKTLLLADWVEAGGKDSTAWVSLDADDNDPNRFWSAVLSAVADCPVVPADSPLRDLTPPQTQDHPSFLADVVDALDTLPSPVRLVLDDLHEVIDHTTLHGIEALIRHQPRSLRLVLSGRLDPPLPLARLRLQGSLAEIRASQLRFSLSDAAALMRAAHVRLDDEQLRLLVEQTEGWAAALRLAAVSLQNSSDPAEFVRQFSNADRAVADYLVGEVLARLPADVREFLRLVSVCEDVTPPLAEALCERSDAGTVLDGLERESSLVTRVGPGQRCYRIHGLLRAYLRADLDRQHPDKTTELHRKAAAWFAAEEQSAAALDHAEQAGAGSWVVDLLRRHAVTLLLTGQHETIRDALVVAGDEPRASDSWFDLISALTHLQAGEEAAADRDLLHCKRLWPREPDDELVLLRHLVESHRRLVQGQAVPDEAPRPPAGAASADRASLLVWARLNEAWRLVLTSDRVRGKRELDSTLQLVRAQGMDYLTAPNLSALAIVAALDGDYAAMEALATESAAVAAGHRWARLPWLGANQLMLALARLLRLDPAGALDSSANAARSAPAGPATRMGALIRFVSGAARFDLGERLIGLRLMQDARRELAGEQLTPHLVALLAVLEHACALALGRDADVQEVLGWARRHGGAGADVHLMTAATKFAAGDLDAARDAMQQATAESGQALVGFTPVAARLLDCAIALRGGQRTRARRALEAALELAEPANLIRPFGVADPAVRQLLIVQLGSFGAAEPFAMRVRGALLDPHIEPAAGLLTERESVVLAGLPSQRSLDDIALEMAISVNTVKTHVRSIYAKLGVNNRRSAVVVAREHGLT